MVLWSRWGVGGGGIGWVETWDVWDQRAMAVVHQGWVVCGWMVARAAGGAWLMGGLGMGLAGALKRAGA